MTAATSSRAGVSPSSSPRLPSPPPFTEVQFGPKSPSIGGSITELQLEVVGKQDESASRRIRPGSKATDMAKGPPFVPLHQLESPFQLQEYLKSLYHKLTRDESSSTVRPITKDMALELASPPTAADTGDTVDRNLWLYELCRFLCSKTTRIIVAFFAENPPCSSSTCPEMRASEWQYLCAVHEPPKSCCAIDYCNHTLDWASNILTSTKHFPSRLSLGGDGGNAYQSMRQLTNIFRRVYRIYAHAWFQHREIFWGIEAELGLYMFFKTVCDVYQLIPEDNYTIPPEAEGEREESLQTPVNKDSPQRVSILQKSNIQDDTESAEEQANTMLSTGATTRRHKHTPSTGVPVAVIAEGAEEEDEASKSTFVSDQALSFERVPSIGHIDLPDRSDAERAPEDPTPVAVHENDPFVFPATQDIAQTTGSKVFALEATELSAPGPAVSTLEIDAVQTPLTAVPDDMKDSTKTNENNLETQTVTEDIERKGLAGSNGGDRTEADGAGREESEVMERIGIPLDIQEKTSGDTNLSSQPAITTSIDDENDETVIEKESSKSQAESTNVP